MESTVLVELPSTVLFPRESKTPPPEAMLLRAVTFAPLATWRPSSNLPPYVVDCERIKMPVGAASEKQARADCIDLLSSLMVEPDEPCHANLNGWTAARFPTDSRFLPYYR
jgi:hypothetical protein